MVAVVVVWAGGVELGCLAVSVIWPSSSVLRTCDVSLQQISICWIKSKFFIYFFLLMEKVTDKLVFKIERKRTQNKLCNTSQCVDFWEEGINQSQTSISVCILLAAHVCQLMKSVHGSPVIDFREVLICRLRSGSSLCPSSFSSSSPLHRPSSPICLAWTHTYALT